MNKKIIREWKKVYRSDLPYIVYELKDLVKTPALVILDGELGAGKTTFTQSFLGDNEVLSPTYALLSSYKNLLHGDFYRLENSDEVIQLEIPLYLEDKQYFFVEWGAKFAPRILRELPENWSSYLLEIKLNSISKDLDDTPTRNFILSSLHDD